MKKLFAALLSMMLVCGCMTGWAETTPLLPGGWAIYRGGISVMHADTEQEIFDRTAFPHTSGTAEELKTAEYLKDLCEELGAQAHLESLHLKLSCPSSRRPSSQGRWA